MDLANSLNLPMNYLDRKDNKKSKKVRQQEKDKKHLQQSLMREILKKIVLRLKLYQLFRAITKQLFKIVIKLLLVRQRTTSKCLRKILFTVMMRMRIYPS